MCFATLLPLGILQLYKSVDEGYFEARELDFLTNDTNTLIEWLRLPGDLVFIVGRAVVALYIAYLGIRHTVKQVTLDEPEDILFTVVDEPEGRRQAGRTRRPQRGSRDPGGHTRCGLRRLPHMRRVRARVAVRAHRRSLRYRTAGFAYDATHDWLCPEGSSSGRTSSTASAGSIRPRPGPHLQRLLGEGPHGLRSRPGDRRGARPSRLGIRALPPCHRPAARRARRPDPGR